MNQYTFQLFRKTAGKTFLKLFGPDGKPIAERPLGARDIQDLATEVGKSYAERAAALTGLGGRLYRWLDGDTDRWLERALKDARELAVHIDVSDGLGDLPWELLCRGGVFLCGNPDRPFTPVRRVSGEPQPVREPANRPLRILLMACSPEDVEPVLDFEAEESMILETTRAQPIELAVEETGTLDGLQYRAESAGRDYYDVFHLTGHADIEDGRPIFIMENDLGFKRRATAGQIAKAFSGNWPRLVFLSGCRTGQAPEGSPLPALCQALVEAGAPAVLGWALPVRDRAASIAAARLYTHLAVGKSVDEAVARARQELLEAECDEWRLLRLYADATPLRELVTPLETAGRKPLSARPAQVEFLDAGAKVEVCPSERFVGRRRPIQRCLRCLRSRQGDGDYGEGVLLHGMGGLGKSSLAARLCERMPGRQRFVWVGRVNEIELLRVLGDRLEAGEAIQVLNDPALPLKTRLRLLLERHLPKTLFVFDDFESSLDMTAEPAAILKPETRDVLVPLLGAIREAASDSRAVVTSRYTFPLPGPAGLYTEGLESMRGAELDKKVAPLAGLRRMELSVRAEDRALADKAKRLAAGNPRLIERLNVVLDQPGLDHAAVLSALEDTAAEFREEVLLAELVALQPPECRGLLALVSVYDLPVDRAAVEAVAGGIDVGRHLETAAALGLVESGRDPASGAPRYLVSRILDPLLDGEVTAAQRTKARRAGVRHLYKAWGTATRDARAEEMLEIHRLARLAKEKDIAVDVCLRIARPLLNISRFREVRKLCAETLDLGDDCRILRGLARAEEALGETAAALEHYERALSGCPEVSSGVPERVVCERSAILHDLAALLTTQGHVGRAMELWEESLRLEEQIGNVRGRAATLHAMAGVHAQQGEIGRAMELWEESLGAWKQIGDVGGRAATLANMAWAAGRQGDPDRERGLNLQAAGALASVRAWPDLVRVLGNLGARDDADAPVFLAQALWLAARVQVPVDDVVPLAAELLSKLGPAADAGPLIAATALYAAQARGRGYPEQDEMQKLAGGMLAACAEARDVADDNVTEWMAAEGLNDPERFLRALDRALEAIVGEDGWLFDRQLLAPRA